MPLRPLAYVSSFVDINPLWHGSGRVGARLRRWQLKPVPGHECTVGGVLPAAIKRYLPADRSNIGGFGQDNAVVYERIWRMSIKRPLELQKSQLGGLCLMVIGHPCNFKRTLLRNLERYRPFAYKCTRLAVKGCILLALVLQSCGKSGTARPHALRWDDPTRGEIP